MTATGDARFLSVSPQQTDQWGTMLGELLQPGDVIALEGDLGAGKTTLTRGIAAGLGVVDPVTSPTFTLIHEYRGRTPMFHIDPYRLDSPEAALELGFEEYLDRGGVVVVEWANRLGPLLLGERLTISIEIAIESGDDDRAVRTLQVSATGVRYVRLLSAFSERWQNAASADREPAP